MSVCTSSDDDEVPIADLFRKNTKKKQATFKSLLNNGTKKKNNGKTMKKPVKTKRFVDMADVHPFFQPVTKRKASKDTEKKRKKKKKHGTNDDNANVHPFFQPMNERAKNAAIERKNRLKHERDEAKKRVERLNDNGGVSPVFKRDVISVNGTKKKKKRRQNHNDRELLCPWPQYTHVNAYTEDEKDVQVVHSSYVTNESMPSCTTTYPNLIMCNNEQIHAILHNETSADVVINLCDDDDGVNLSVVDSFITSKIGVDLCQMWTNQTPSETHKRIQAQFCRLAERRLDRKLKHEMWTRRYAPSIASHTNGNTTMVEFVKKWIVQWQPPNHPINQALYRRRCSGYDSDDDFVVNDDDDDDYGSGVGVIEREVLTAGMAIIGSHGVGKSALVYACASELGYEVLEVNLGNAKKDISLDKWIGEATRSHRLDASSTKSSKSIILLDEIDLVTLDNRMLRDIRSLLKHTKRPIVFTCNNFFEKLRALDIGWCYMTHADISIPTTVTLLQMIGIIECGVSLLTHELSFHNLTTLLQQNHMDLRKTIVSLQFWLSTQHVSTHTALNIETKTRDVVDDVQGDDDVIVTSYNYAINNVYSSYLQGNDGDDDDEWYNIAELLSTSDMIVSHLQQDQEKQPSDCENATYRYEFDEYEHVCRDHCACCDFEDTYLHTHFDMAIDLLSVNKRRLNTPKRRSPPFGLAMNDFNQPLHFNESVNQVYWMDLWKNSIATKYYFYNSYAFVLDYIPNIHILTLLELHAGYGAQRRRSCRRSGSNRQESHRTSMYMFNKLDRMELRVRRQVFGGQQLFEEDE